MKPAAIIATILATLLLAAPAGASAETPTTLGTPAVIPLRSFDGFLAATAYTIPEGDAAIITYKVYRHRAGPGFRLVRTVHHTVGAGDGQDSAKLRTPLWYGVGYRIKTHIVNVSTAERVKAPTVKVHL